MQLDFNKMNGLIPTIIQDSNTQEVLMLGYMNQDAIDTTHRTGKVTFFSRSKNRLWTKGESSGNYLKYISMTSDCDQDALLIKAIPAGPTCHKGSQSCFGEAGQAGMIYKLQQTILDRKDSGDTNSYTKSLLDRGINKVAQKVGEEAVELVIEAKDNNDDLFLNEAADLLYHTLVLLAAKNKSISDVEQVLFDRHK